MNAQYELATLLGFAALLVVGALFLHRRTRNREPKDQLPVRKISTIPTAADDHTRIAVGQDVAHTILTISRLRAALEYEEAKPLKDSNGTLSRLGALVQAIPSLAVAGETSGKRLMEVANEASSRQAARYPSDSAEHIEYHRIFGDRSLECLSHHR